MPEVLRERRSHAERRADTRQRIISAAVKSIAELGFQRTTAMQIAERAGVTWGAVQHHFGGKDGMLHAVLEETFRRFEERIGDLNVEKLSLESRVSLFVDRAWEHFSSDHYRSTFEILLNDAPEAPDNWQLEMSRSWDRVWSRVFSDAAISRQRHYTLQHYTVSALSGLASTKILGGNLARTRAAELDLLKDTLIKELSAKKGSRS